MIAVVIKASGYDRMKECRITGSSSAWTGRMYMVSAMDRIMLVDDDVEGTSVPFGDLHSFNRFL